MRIVESGLRDYASYLDISATSQSSDTTHTLRPVMMRPRNSSEMSSRTTVFISRLCWNRGVMILKPKIFTTVIRPTAGASGSNRPMDPTFVQDAAIRFPISRRSGRTSDYLCLKISILEVATASDFAEEGIAGRMTVIVTLQGDLGLGVQPLQRNETVVVPVATVLAFTQLRSTMPGAPYGFGDILTPDTDFTGVLLCLVPPVHLYPAKDSREKVNLGCLSRLVLPKVLSAFTKLLLNNEAHHRSTSLLYP
ncbi:hypothetical protein IW262DRAFT_1300212 [Armillaria fumosa]|nr:hypothetical protein IW262DRAFT_1300212 [Armillaria fumosa]